MTLLAIGLCLLCQVCEVGGHLFLKHGMNATNLVPPPWPVIIRNVARGARPAHALVPALARPAAELGSEPALFPFEGLSPPLLVLGAWLFLKEHVPARAWLGIRLIGGGVALVAAG